MNYGKLREKCRMWLRNPPPAAKALDEALADFVLDIMNQQQFLIQAIPQAPTSPIIPAEPGFALVVATFNEDGSFNTGLRIPVVAWEVSNVHGIGPAAISVTGESSRWLQTPGGTIIDFLEDWVWDDVGKWKRDFERLQKGESPCETVKFTSTPVLFSAWPE